MRDISIRFLRRAVGVSAAFLLVVASATPALRVYAADEGLSTVTNKVTTPGTPVTITDLQVTGTGNDSVSLTIQVDKGELSLDGSNINVSGNYSSLLTLSGDREDINTSLSTLTYEGEGRGTSTVTVSLGSNVTDVIIDPDTGRAYTIVGDELTWNDARTAALQLQYGGVQGYLANVTSEEEDEFIVANLSGNGWIGASDYDEDGGEELGEGDWKWVDGPEAGTSFWSGAGAGNGGQPVLGPGDVPMYSNWNDIEPNNSGDEDCAEYIVGEGWNDLSCVTEYRGYVVEFGAGLNAPDPIERTFTITATPETVSIGSCDQLFALTGEDANKKIELTAHIDCQGRTEAPLFDEEDFYGIFEGNGFTIKNLTIANEDSSHVGLTGYSVGAEYRNIFLDNISLEGGFHNGVLAGHVEDSIIAENIHATNITMKNSPDETSVEEMGVLFGTVGLEREYGESRIEHVSVQGTFTITDVESVEGVGGLAGTIEAGGDFVIKQAYADVDIVLNNVSDYSESVGGLVGYIDTGGEGADEGSSVVQGITDSYTWGSITAPSGVYVGGLVGNIGNYFDDAAAFTFDITNSYSWMDIDAYSDVGGLVGFMQRMDPYEGATYDTAIINSFYAGTVTGEENTGVIVGTYEDFEEEYSTLEFDNVWYDASKTGEYDCVSNLPVNQCNAINADGNQPNYFFNSKTNAPMDEWDFATIWKTGSSTPPTFKSFIGNDGDQDGANDYIETRAPNNGDGNNDGTADSEQSHVASFVNLETGKYITLALSEECSITEVMASKESDGEAQDAEYEYLNGLVNFAADCGTPGFTTNVTVYHHGVSKDGLTVRKYNPTTGEYFTIASASLADQVIGGQNAAVVSYQITDGGELDVDGEENGTIVDPVGLGSQSLSDGSSVGGALSATGQNRFVILLIAALSSVGGLYVLLRRIRVLTADNR